MSTQPTGAGRRILNIPELPSGDLISTYDHYQDAKQAVDRLARANFPVSEVSIVGNDLHSVERVTGKLTYGRVALSGALSGAYLGLFLGILLFIFQPENSAVFGVFMAAIAIGAGFGMLFGVLSYSMNKNKRDFASMTQFIAKRYDLVTQKDFIDSARAILTKSEGI